MRRPFIAACLAALATTVAAAGEPPTRIVSINLCADQLVLALADPEGIVGLSAVAHDPDMAFLVEKARRYPETPGNAEAVYALEPDLVVTGTFSNPLTNAFLAAKGVPTLVLDAVSSLADVRAEIVRVADAVGRPERGAALLADLDAALARAADVRPPEPLRVVVLSRRGWVSGTRTLESELLAAVGLTNAAADFGVADYGGIVGLEALIAADLDLVMLESDTIAAEDQGSALLRHPAVLEAFPPEKRIVIPGPLTLCGGPGVIAALDRLAAEVAALRR
jgi:iron complex transport system substrate-binding protein